MLPLLPQVARALDLPVFGGPGAASGWQSGRGAEVRPIAAGRPGRIGVVPSSTNTTRSDFPDTVYSGTDGPVQADTPATAHYVWIHFDRSMDATIASALVVVIGDGLSVGPQVLALPLPALVASLVTADWSPSTLTWNNQPSASDFVGAFETSGVDAHVVSSEAPMTNGATLEVETGSAIGSAFALSILLSAAGQQTVYGVVLAWDEWLSQQRWADIGPTYAAYRT